MTLAPIRRIPRPPEPLFTLRHYDRFDGWVDCWLNAGDGTLKQTNAVPLERAEEELAKEVARAAAHGREQVEGENYYRIFPADTVMLQRPETMDR